MYMCMWDRWVTWLTVFGWELVGGEEEEWAANILINIVGIKKVT